MDQTLEDLKKQLADQLSAMQAINNNIGGVKTSLDGIGADVVFLKDKITSLQTTGATPEQITDLANLANSVTESIATVTATLSNLGQAAAALDEQTTPDAQQPAAQQ